MLTFIFLGFLAVVAVFLGVFVIRGRSRQAQGKSGVAVETKQQQVPKNSRASGMD